MIWKNVTPDVAIKHASERVQSSYAVDLFGNGRCEILFTDGTGIAVESAYDEDYSENTPGMGIMPPTWYVGTKE